MSHSLRLRKIDISSNRFHRHCNHDDIRDDKKYLVYIYDKMYIGQFSKQWYGWNFRDWSPNMAGGMQLDGIQAVYEVLWLEAVERDDSSKPASENAPKDSK